MTTKEIEKSNGVRKNNGDTAKSIISAPDYSFFLPSKSS